MEKEQNKKELYKVENYKIVMPLEVNSDRIFDSEKFIIKTWQNGEDIKFVFLQKKKDEK